MQRPAPGIYLPPAQPSQAPGCGETDSYRVWTNGLQVHLSQEQAWLITKTLRRASSITQAAKKLRETKSAPRLQREFRKEEISWKRHPQRNLGRCCNNKRNKSAMKRRNQTSGRRAKTRLSRKALENKAQWDCLKWGKAWRKREHVRKTIEASLVVQGLRLGLPMQEVWIWSLVGKWLRQ